MTGALHDIIRQIFRTDSLSDVTVSQLEDLCRDHPYFSTGRFLLSKKLYLEKSGQFSQEIEKTALYFSNPFWLQWLLQHSTDEPPVPPNAGEPISAQPLARPLLPDPPGKSQNKEAEAPRQRLSDDILLFEPYHTVDYFASQGIRFVADENPPDRFGRQLKSFTDWLKIMKKLPVPGKDGAVTSTAEQARIDTDAALSILQKEVLTESMAEVLAKQGKTQDAVDLYRKLSLQDSAKSAYFAAKIEELNTP